MDDYYKKVTALLEEYLNFKKPDVVIVSLIVQAFIVTSADML